LDYEKKKKNLLDKNDGGIFNEWFKFDYF